MIDVEQNFAMTREQYAEAFELLERLREMFPGAAVIEIESGKVSK